METKLYRLSFTVNRISGNISSNTIFGLFCEAYRIRNSEDELEILLDMLENNEEELVFSNPLIVGTFELIDRVKNYQSVHALIGRDTNKKDVYSVTEKMYSNFDVLCYTSLNISELIETVKILGIGARKSVGSGQILSIEVKEQSDIKLGNTGIMLSDAIPSEDTPTNGIFEYITRYGVTRDGISQNIYIMLKAGSKLYKPNNIITGSIIKDSNTNTYVNGKSIIV